MSSDDRSQTGQLCVLVIMLLVALSICMKTGWTVWSLAMATLCVHFRPLVAHETVCAPTNLMHHCMSCTVGTLRLHKHTVVFQKC